MEVAIGAGYAQTLFAIGDDRSGGFVVVGGFGLTPNDLEGVSIERSPCGGPRAEAAHEIVYSSDRLAPVDLAGVSMNLWGRGCRGAVLRLQLVVSGLDELDGLEDELCAFEHHPVVHVSGGIVWPDGDAVAEEDVSGVDFLL